MRAEPNVVGEVLGSVADHEREITEIDSLELTAEDRSRGHVRARTHGGREMLVSLERGHELREGDVLMIEEGVAVVVAAAPEDLLEVRPTAFREWAIAAYQLGNLHKPVRFEEDGFVTPYDSSSEDALRRLNVAYRRLTRPFTGERVKALAGGHHGHGH